MDKLKGLILLSMLSIGTWTAQAQTDNLPAHFSQEEMIIDDPFTSKWELSVHGGWGYRVDNSSLELLALVQSTTFHVGGTGSLSTINDLFFRYFPFVNFWRR